MIEQYNDILNATINDDIYIKLRQFIIKYKLDMYIL